MSKLFPKNPILLVDDEADTLQVYKRMLFFYGISNLILCESSKEAISVLKGNDISLVLLDLTMPEMSGRDLLNHIKHLVPDVPVIVISGLDRGDADIGGNIFDYLLKPVLMERLKMTVYRALQIDD